jgi:hypothetical protein
MANTLKNMVNGGADKDDKENKFLELVWDAVIPFRSHAEKKKSKNLPNAYLRDARTLNAIIAFCFRLSAIKEYPCLELNEKVKAILTLNYDWFLEGGASQKSRREDIFKPMARESSKSIEGKLPVYHIHGYFPFNRDEKPDCEIILTNTTYIRAYEDISENSLKNRILNEFLCRYPTLFIGVSFDDE